MHNTQSRLPVNDNDVITLGATIGTFEAVVFFFELEDIKKLSLVPSGTLVKLRVSRYLIWGTSGLSICPRCIWAAKIQKPNPIYCYYMIRHYYTFLKELVVRTSLSYTNMSMQSLVIQCKISQTTKINKI